MLQSISSVRSVMHAPVPNRVAAAKPKPEAKIEITTPAERLRVWLAGREVTIKIPRFHHVIDTVSGLLSTTDDGQVKIRRNQSTESTTLTAVIEVDTLSIVASKTENTTGQAQIKIFEGKGAGLIEMQYHCEQGTDLTTLPPLTVKYHDLDPSQPRRFRYTRVVRIGPGTRPEEPKYGWLDMTGKEAGWMAKSSFSCNVGVSRVAFETKVVTSQQVETRTSTPPEYIRAWLAPSPHDPTVLQPVGKSVPFPIVQSLLDEQMQSELQVVYSSPSDDPEDPVFQSSETVSVLLANMPLLDTRHPYR